MAEVSLVKFYGFYHITCYNYHSAISYPSMFHHRDWICGYDRKMNKKQYPLPQGHIVGVIIGPHIPKIQFDLENSRSKVNFKVTTVSQASSLLISFVFHIRASYQLPSLSFHESQASHSWDSIWHWKFKVIGQGQTTLISVASRWLISFLFPINWINHS